MIKLILLTAALSLTQLAVAEETKAPSKTMDMSAVSKAHAAIKKADKNAPFWSKDQAKQAELEVKYKKAIAKNPDDKQSHAYLAGLYISNNKNSKAIDAYQDAITVDPENPKLFAALSIAYLHHAKYSMAQAMATEALRLDPTLKGVEKINEYIVAKQEAIEAASKTPASGAKIDISKGVGLHGSVMPAATGSKPSDKIHNPK
ncbi:MAG TPA: hypothetical protein EYG68_10875 [Leucothrix mucor]|nr:hypothetical protein [Leucothrix mucor]